MSDSFRKLGCIGMLWEVYSYDIITLTLTEIVRRGVVVVVYSTLPR